MNICPVKLIFRDYIQLILFLRPIIQDEVVQPSKVLKELLPHGMKYPLPPLLIKLSYVQRRQCWPQLLLPLS